MRAFALQRTSILGSPCGLKVPTRRVSKPAIRSERGRVFCKLAEEEKTKPVKEDPDQVTKKWGLEAGLWKAMTSKGEEDGLTGADKAKELLKKYGSAYLITSISFAIVSFSICYALVSAGVDVRSLLGNFGLEVGSTGERVGTVAIAYAAHKALSPVRFPPTVALTPVVANLLGKKPTDDEPPAQENGAPQ
ncbi:hypothetical protein BSKO_05617 [Bryopsis sp. KO-2023]|nr:hypothetical protein BSKO_05617 [Bryopsis sp. KO-2023]